MKRQGQPARQIHLKVTADHCARGCRKDAANCMIAQAIMDRIPQATHLHCTTKEIAWSDPIARTRNRYFQVPVGERAIRRFDAGKPVKPFELHLNDGITFPMGWRAKHPGSTRKGKVYKRTGKHDVRYTRFRSFGAGNIKDHEATT